MRRGHNSVEELMLPNMLTRYEVFSVIEAITSEVIG